MSDSIEIWDDGKPNNVVMVKVEPLRRMRGARDRVADEPGVTHILVPEEDVSGPDRHPAEVLAVLAEHLGKASDRGAAVGLDLSNARDLDVVAPRMFGLFGNDRAHLSGLRAQPSTMGEIMAAEGAAATLAQADVAPHTARKWGDRLRHAHRFATEMTVQTSAQLPALRRWLDAHPDRDVERENALAAQLLARQPGNGPLLAGVEVTEGGVRTAEFFGTQSPQSLHVHIGGQDGQWPPTEHLASIANLGVRGPLANSGDWVAQTTAGLVGRLKSAPRRITITGDEANVADQITAAAVLRSKGFDAATPGERQTAAAAVDPGPMPRLHAIPSTPQRPGVPTSTRPVVGGQVTPVRR